jgi:NAD(P)-dependent dehydrogenase (short-subunit alcohol dehydrogenase family)
MRLNSSVSAVVTGGASGLGEATVRALAARSVRVAVFDVNSELGEAVARDVDGIFCRVDVTSDESVDNGFERCRAAIGQERILVACAGIGDAAKTARRDRETRQISHFPLALFDRVIQVNLVGTFRCIAKSAAGMLTLPPQEDGDRGVIISTASVAAEDGQVGQAAYAASKSGIVGLTLPVARDLMNESIRVNSILPGTFATPMLQAAAEKVKAALAASVPYPKRMGEPNEYAHLVMSMIDNGYLNGASVRLDGAIRMAPR